MDKRGDTTLYRGVLAGVIALFIGNLPILYLSRSVIFGYVATWILAIVVGLIVAYRTWKRETPDYWARHGRCTRCGYDLRGSPEGRCPECGHASKERS